MALRLASFRRDLFRFRRARGGAIAVEFALAIGPILGVLLFLADMVANHFVFRRIDMSGAALMQQMRAGTLDAKSYSAQSFRDAQLCPVLPVLTCERFIVSLASLSLAPLMSSSDLTRARWCPGGPGEIVILQIAYPMPFLSRIWAGSFADQTLYYVKSFALRNAPDAVPGSC